LSCVFRPGNLVLRFPVLLFPPLPFGPVFSSPAFSTPVFFMVPLFPVPRFQSPPPSVVRRVDGMTSVDVEAPRRRRREPTSAVKWRVSARHDGAVPIRQRYETPLLRQRRSDWTPASWCFRDVRHDAAKLAIDHLRLIVYIVYAASETAVRWCILIVMYLNLFISTPPLMFGVSAPHFSPLTSTCLVTHKCSLYIYFPVIYFHTIYTFGKVWNSNVIVHLGRSIQCNVWICNGFIGFSLVIFVPSLLWYSWLGVSGCLSEARCRLFAYGPADATAISKPHHILPHLNPDWFYLSGIGLPRLSWKRAC